MAIQNRNNEKIKYYSGINEFLFATNYVLVYFYKK